MLLRTMFLALVLLSCHRGTGTTPRPTPSPESTPTTEPAVATADRSGQVTRECLARPGYQGVYEDDCNETGICEDAARARFVRCQATEVAESAPSGSCAGLEEGACRQRDDCVIIHYSDDSESYATGPEDTLGAFAECFPEPATNACLSDAECGGGRCDFADRTCANTMCWGVCR